MSQLADLFPGFAEHRVETAVTQIHARSGGSGPPLLLLHGYPQTHVCWHRVAPILAQRFTIVAADLRGYGSSGCPPSGHAVYGKRAMAADMIEVMGALGHATFGIAGHDRGGRVAYRMALDHPHRVTRLAVLDIVPTSEVWDGFTADEAMAKFHWPFLAQDAPLPENLLAAEPMFWLENLLARWSLAGDLSCFDERALAHYRANFADRLRIHATCEDYRAGATVDRQLDEDDRRAGRRIACPTLALWGGGKSVGTSDDPLLTWRSWCDSVEGRALACGHYLPEERPDETADALGVFFAQG